jgi:hypothetical protein
MQSYNIIMLPAGVKPAGAGGNTSTFNFSFSSFLKEIVENIHQTENIKHLCTRLQVAKN